MSPRFEWQRPRHGRYVAIAFGSAASLLVLAFALLFAGRDTYVPWLVIAAVGLTMLMLAVGRRG